MWSLLFLRVLPLENLSGREPLPSHTIKRTLHRACEVANFDIRCLALDYLNHRAHTQRLAHRVQVRHTWQEHFGIDVEIAQLDQAQARLLNKGQERLNFSLTVDQTRKAQKIDRAIEASIMCSFERLFNIIKRITE